MGPNPLVPTSLPLVPPVLPLVPCPVLLLVVLVTLVPSPKWSLGLPMKKSTISTFTTTIVVLRRKIQGKALHLLNFGDPDETFAVV